MFMDTIVPQCKKLSVTKYIRNIYGGEKRFYLNFNCFRTQNIKFRKNAQTVDERIDD